MVDGKNVLALASSQDHKRIGDGDTGPNTGGMGAYSPCPVVTPEIHAKAMREIILPTVRGMAADGIPYTGFLYAGLMIGKDGSVKTLEFNCRMGDPETQPILMRLKSDFVALLEHGVAGTLDQVEAEWDRRVALGVVLAAAITRDAARKATSSAACRWQLLRRRAHVFHAGTPTRDGRVSTSGGRVLCVTALGENVARPRNAPTRPPAQIVSGTACGIARTSVTGRSAADPVANQQKGGPAHFDQFFSSSRSTMDTTRLRDYFTGLQRTHRQCVGNL